MPRKQAFPQVQSNKVFGHPLRVGLYARVSTHDQQTLPLQIRAMREYAAKRNWAIVAHIKEVGSGASHRELRGDRVRAGLAHARLNGKRLGRPPSAAHKAIEARNLYRQGISKSEIAR